ncbi:MAG: sulfate respiration complex protein HmcD [Pseudomonadota bacterium]
MEQSFFTLQDFMVHTKAVIYVLMGVSLVGIVGFWFFLTGKEGK